MLATAVWGHQDILGGRFQWQCMHLVRWRYAVIALFDAFTYYGGCVASFAFQKKKHIGGYCHPL